MNAGVSRRSALTRVRLEGVTRVSLVLVLLLGGSLAAAAPAAQARRIASHCSPSGDVCYGIFKDGSLFRFKLTTAARYFSRYRICVRPAGQSATCKSFPVRRMGASWGGNVVWQRNFPARGPRTYLVTWKLGAQRLGPSLRFTLPAPV